MRPAMRPRKIHWRMERSSRVRSQYAKNTATTKAEEESEKTVERCAKGHRVTIRRGETVGGDGGPEGASNTNATVRDEQERRPKDGGADSEMIFKMAGG